MGIFKFFSSRIPSKPRNKDLQTNGSVNVSVQKNVGMRTENASTVVNNISVTDNYKGRITISDLLLIPSSSVGANDLYLVYSSGSDEAGWSQGGAFTYEGETYSDGTFMQWMIDRWVAVDRDQTEEKQPTLFNPLQKLVSLISKTYSQSSYDNLPGRVKAGIPIAEVRNYELDEAGVYQEKKESQTGSQSAETNVKTLVVPFARSYTQGGEMVYEGGALTPSDYERLCKGGSGDYVDLTSSQHISGDKTFTFLGLKENNRGDGGESIAFYNKDGDLKFVMGFDEGDDFPVVSMYDSQWRQKRIAYEGDFAMSVLFDGKFYYANNGIIDLSNASIATRTWVNQQGFLKSVPSTYVQKEDLVGYATQSWVNANFPDKIWVNSQGFLKADDVKKFASTEFVFISVTNTGSSYEFTVEDKSFATAIVRDDSTRYTLKLELGFSNLTSAREFLRDYRVSVTQTNSTVQFPDSASIVTVDYLGLHIWLEINMTQGAVDPDPTAWYGIQFTKLNNISR